MYEKCPPPSSSFCLKTFICELSRTAQVAETLCSLCGSCQTSMSSHKSPSTKWDMDRWVISNRRQQ